MEPCQMGGHSYEVQCNIIELGRQVVTHDAPINGAPERRILEEERELPGTEFGSGHAESNCVRAGSVDTG